MDPFVYRVVVAVAVVAAVDVVAAVAWTVVVIQEVVP